MPIHLQVFTGCLISVYTNEQVQKIEDWINNYPWKLFGGLSSNQYCQSFGLLL